MRKSTWRFKRSPSIDPRFLRHDLPFICTLTTIISVASCQLSRKPDLEPPHSVTTEAPPLSVRPPLAPAELTHTGQLTSVIMAAVGETSKGLAFNVSVSDCNAPVEKAEVRLKTQLESDFGSQTVHLTLRGNEGAETVRAEIESFRLSFPVTMAVKAKLAGEVCNAVRTNSPEFAVEPKILEEARSWLAQIAPDCESLTPVKKLELGVNASANATGGWYCQLPQIEPATARSDLNRMQTLMIKRWSRQPYLLTRRLAIGISLANALETTDQDDHRLNTFCRVIQASLPIELPATIASKRWQAAVCGQDLGHRLTAARFGLTKTVAEIEFMQQLFDRTSRLGLLTLRIPNAVPHGRDVLVTLIPRSDVADNVARQTRSLWQGEPGHSTFIPSVEAPRSCWHPVFAEDTGLLRLARQLALTGEAPKVACEESDMVPNLSFSPDRYFAESITSETEFSIPNARAKTLRLPIGRYAYKLRLMPENQEDWDDASQVKEGAAGEIVWDAKRPRPVINTW